MTHYSNVTRHAVPDADSSGIIGAIRAVDRFRFQSKASAHAAEQFKKWASKQLLPISSAWEAGGDEDDPDTIGHGYVVELSANDLIEVGKRAKQIAERHHTYYRVDRIADHQYLVYFTDNPAGVAVATATTDGIYVHEDALGSLMDRWESATKGEGKIRRLQNRIQRMEERLAKARQELCDLDPNACPSVAESEAAGLTYIGEIGRVGRGGARRMGGGSRGGFRMSRSSSMGRSAAMGRSSTSRSSSRSPFTRSSREALQIPSTSSRLNTQQSGYSPTRPTSTGRPPFGQDQSGQGQSGQGQGGYGGQQSSSPSIVYIDRQQPSYIPVAEPQPQVIVVQSEQPEDDIYEKERLLGYLEEEERLAREQPQVIVVPTEGVRGVRQRREVALGNAHDVATRIASMIPGARYQDYDVPRVAFRDFHRGEIQEAMNDPRILRVLAGTPYQIKGSLDELYVELDPQAPTRVGAVHRVASLGGASGPDFLPDLPYGDVWTDVQYPGFGG